MLNLEPGNYRKVLQIEKAVLSGVQRGIDQLYPASAGSLAKLIASLLQTQRPVIGIVSGFVIMSVDPPVCETDGPIGVALLVRLCRVFGWTALALTDDWCESILSPLLSDSGLASNRIFVARTLKKSAVEERIERARGFLEAHAVTHLVSLERPGRGYDGRYHNMMGDDITDFVYGFDDLFVGAQWRTAGFGDGGNEIGMGAVPRTLIAEHVHLGESVASATPVDFNVLCGVSNWGAYALAAGLAAVLPERAREIRDALNDETERRLMQIALAAGAVDGTNGKAALSVDGMDQDVHLKKKQELFALAGSLSD